MLQHPSKTQYSNNRRVLTYYPFIAEWKTLLTPLALYRRVKSNAPLSILLESARSGSQGRYSYVLTKPKGRFTSKGSQCTWIYDDKEEFFHIHPLEALKNISARFPMVRPRRQPPFLGGFCGIFNYEFKNQIERLEPVVHDPYALPDVDLGFYEQGIVYDHLLKNVRVFVLHRSETNLEESFQGGMRACLNFLSEVKASAERLDVAKTFEALAQPNLVENRDAFIQKVVCAQEMIRQGEIFQANLSHAMSFAYQGDGCDLYRRLQIINPTSFGAYADFGDWQLVCGSPERLVKLEGGIASTRPIAGTRPRSLNKELDEELSLELLLNAKERAEHLMLVDLERNDLGRVSAFGTVQVNEWMVIENYSHVRHIVSNVVGQLRPNKDVWDLIRSVFPGGTITGAPKVRAMQIIDELEAQCRGPYTGSIGYIGLDGTCDLNIVIRSVLLKGHSATLQVGAGIVADSDPEGEYKETLDKAEAILQILTQNVTERITA